MVNLSKTRLFSSKKTNFFVSQEVSFEDFFGSVRVKLNAFPEDSLIRAAYLFVTKPFASGVVVQQLINGTTINSIPDPTTIGSIDSTDTGIIVLDSTIVELTLNQPIGQGSCIVITEFCEYDKVTGEQLNFIETL